MSVDYLLFDAEINKEKVDIFISWAISRMGSGTTEFYIAFSTSGGNVNAGLRMAEFIRAIDVDVTMHNISSVASMGIPVFCSAKKRNCSKHSTTVFHGSGLTSGDRLDEQVLTNLLSSVKNQNDLIARSISDTSGMSFDECRALLVGEKSKTADWALKNGICQEICDFVIPNGVRPITLF